MNGGVSITHDDEGNVILMMGPEGAEKPTAIMAMEPIHVRTLIEKLEKHLQIAEARLGVIDQQEIEAIEPKDLGEGLAEYMGMIKERTHRAPFMKVLEPLLMFGQEDSKRLNSLITGGMMAVLALHVMELEAKICHLPTHQGEHLTDHMTTMAADIQTLMEVAAKRGLKISTPPGVRQ